MWTGFRAFAPIMSTLAVPLTLAAVGIILRGSGFAFRKASITLSTRRTFGALFAASSVLTPFFLGSVVGGVASGRVPAVGTGSLSRSWVNPTSMLGGVLAVVVCAFLAAVYLTADADRQGDDALTAYFRGRDRVGGRRRGRRRGRDRRARRRLAPLRAHLTGRAFPVLVASAVAGITTLALLVRARYSVARISAAAAVVAVVWGWAAGQYPYLINGRLTISAAAGAHATLQALLGAVAAGIVVIGPALVWLLLLARRGDLGPEHGERQGRGRPGRAKMRAENGGRGRAGPSEDVTGAGERSVPGRAKMRPETVIRTGAGRRTGPDERQTESDCGGGVSRR